MLVSPMLQVLVTLRFYATGSFQLMVGDNTGISKATVSRQWTHYDAIMTNVDFQLILK